MPASLRNHLAALVGCLVILSLSACPGKPGGGKAKGGKDKDPDKEEAVPVEVATIATGPLEAMLRFSANLEAERQVLVLSRAAGQVKSLRVEEGDRVKQGQVLLRLQDDEARAQVDRAKIANAQAQRAFDKQTKLHGQGIASDQALEAAEFELQRTKVALREARLALEYTTVRAAIGGTITMRSAKLGDFVNPNQQLFQITDFDSLVARVYVPEKELRSLEPGLVARIFAQDNADEQREGKVDRVAPAVDPRTGTVKVTISIPETKGLLPGMFVDVELVTDEKANALLLPKRALVYDNDEPYAFKLVGEDRVERIRVQPALTSRDFLEPAADFAAGDRVVVAGQVGLKDGALVSVQPAPTAAATQTPDAAPAQ